MPFDANRPEPDAPSRPKVGCVNWPARVGALATPLGRILVAWLESDGGPLVTGVRLAAEGLPAADAPDWISEAFAAYFVDPTRAVALDWTLGGTEHQRAVWRRISAIPSGSTVTYGNIATALGSSARAVGNACRANPVPLLVPCHRVVAKTGLGGFAGDTSGRLRRIKGWLLAHEQGVERG
jgi:methylated-DNA-[protein]-cysteine S-methyltransferase